MEKYIQVVKEIISRKFEEEWFEFKENWFNAHGIGEYISALSKSKLNYLVINQRKYELFFILPI